MPAKQLPKHTVETVSYNICMAVVTSIGCLYMRGTRDLCTSRANGQGTSLSSLLSAVLPTVAISCATEVSLSDFSESYLWTETCCQDKNWHEGYLTQHCQHQRVPQHK